MSVGDGIFCGNFAGGFAVCGRRVTFWADTFMARWGDSAVPGLTLIRSARSPFEGKDSWATARVAPTAKTNRERWFDRQRRRSGTAPKANFANPGPWWGRTELHPITPDFVRRKDSANPKG